MNNLRLALLCTLATSLELACSDDLPPIQTTTGATDTDTDGTGGTTDTPGTTAPPPTTGATSESETTQGTTADPDGTTTTQGETTDPGTTTEVGTTEGSGSTTEMGSTSESGSTGMGVVDDTLYEIQDGTIPTGTDVDVQGVIVTGVSGSGFFVQEVPGGQYSGLYVYLAAPPMVAVGDEVDILGTTEEFNDLTEIDASMGTVTPTGVTGVDLMPTVVAAADLTAMTGEPWEGVLVRIEGVPLTVSNLPGFSEFDVNDGGADDTRIDNFLYSVLDFPGVFPNFGLGATFTAIQGPLNFTFGEFKVAPRDETDLEGYVEGPPPPPMGFGDCATLPEMDACMMSELCVVDDPGMPTVAVCTEFGCAVAADCPPAPPGGDAPVECGDVNGDGMPADCFLDCSAGQTCPTGMDCFMSFLCVWPA